MFRNDFWSRRNTLMPVDNIPKRLLSIGDNRLAILYGCTVCMVVAMYSSSCSDVNVHGVSSGCGSWSGHCRLLGEAAAISEGGVNILDVHSFKIVIVALQVSGEKTGWVRCSSSAFWTAMRTRAKPAPVPSVIETAIKVSSKLKMSAGMTTLLVVIDGSADVE